MKTLEAVIELGSTGVRILVAEITENNSWKILDFAERPVTLGRDVFTSGVVSKDTLLQCLRILYRYREVLSGWAIKDSEVTVIATSAMREARNRDSIIDRIRVKTGFSIKVIDGIEENRLMYIAVSNTLQTELSKMKKNNSIILEVGGGSTEIMLLNKGKMAAAHSLRLGTVIIDQHVKSMMGTQKDVRRFLEEYIRNTGGNLNAELVLEHVQQFIAVGTEASLVARLIGTQLSERCWMIVRSDFENFVEQVQNYTVEECISQFKISYNDAEALQTGLLAYKLFLNLTAAEELIIPDTSIREGIIISKISEPNPILQEEFYSQVIASAMNLGRKYHFDEHHADYVRIIALQLFDKLQQELGLDRYGRLLLEAAALLHDIGTYIRNSDHHLHSHYIIAHSEIFGLNKEAMTIVAHVARYHRGMRPTIHDTAFFALPRTERTTALKLASVLRIADSLDRGHSQHLQDFDIELHSDILHIRTKGTHDMTLERLALKEKSDLFTDLFGYTVVLV